MQIVLVFHKTSNEKIIIKIGYGASRKKLENEIDVLSHTSGKCSSVVTMLFHSTNDVGAMIFFIATKLNKKKCSILAG